MTLLLGQHPARSTSVCMQPTPVQICVMDSQKPGQVMALPVRHLTVGQRAGRGVVLMLAVSLPAALFALLPPHFCQALARSAAIFEPAEIPCPKCSALIPLPKNLTGWPARFPCPKCRAMVELRLPVTLAA